MDKAYSALLLIGLPGLLLAGWMGYSIYEEQEQLRTAVEVKGTVINASTATPEGGRDGPTGLDPDIWYRYTYEGETYVSNSVFPGGDMLSGVRGTDEGPVNGDLARRLVNRYEDRSSITVYVNPRDPDESYLVKNTRGDFQQVFFLFVGLVMALGSMRMLLES